MGNPIWLTDELLKNSLVEIFKEKCMEVLNYSFSPVVPEGDNYTSELLRVVISYRKGKTGNTETIPIILKSSPRGGLMEELIRNMNLFDKEVQLFSRILPAIHSTLGKKTVLSSECYYIHRDGPHIILAIEDLKPKGFLMQERHQGLDLDHCLMVMEKIAKFHAGSKIVCDQNPHFITDIFFKGIYSELEHIKQWMALAVLETIKVVRNWKGYEKYARKLERIVDEIFPKAMEAAEEKPGDFNVLNHGDLWLNNMMFSYCQDQLQDLRFVDFQLCRYTSPAVDLHYFIGTSPSDDVKKNHINKLIDHYYTTFSKTMEVLKYSNEDVPTKEEFLEDYKSRAFYGFIGSITVGPFVKAGHRKDANFESWLKDDHEGSFRHHCFNNPRIKSSLQALLPYYDGLGVFD